MAKRKKTWAEKKDIQVPDDSWGLLDYLINAVHKTCRRLGWDFTVTRQTETSRKIETWLPNATGDQFVCGVDVLIDLNNNKISSSLSFVPNDGPYFEPMQIQKQESRAFQESLVSEFKTVCDEWAKKHGEKSIYSISSENQEGSKTDGLDVNISGEVETRLPQDSSSEMQAIQNSGSEGVGTLGFSKTSPTSKPVMYPEQPDQPIPLAAGEVGGMINEPGEHARQRKQSQQKKRPRRDALDRVALARYYMGRDRLNRTSAARKCGTTKEAIGAYWDHEDVRKMLEYYRTHPDDAELFRRRTVQKKADRKSNAV